MKLIDREWKSFEIRELFNVYTGGDLIISRIEKGDIPIISHSKENNGIVDYTKEISNKKLFNASKTISLADRGTFYAYTQQIDFYIGTRVKALESKFGKCNKYILSFIANSINNQAVRFSYGYNATNKTEKIRFLLPTKQEQPDYDFMECYMKEIEKKQFKKYKQYLEIIMPLEEIADSLEKVEWKSFKINEIFNIITRGKRLTKANQIQGYIPYISSSMLNNGVDGFIAGDKGRQFEDCITLANSGSVGSCFYQAYKFIGSDHITALKNEKFNKYVYLYLANMLQTLKEKYSFNREINDTRLRKDKIVLPVDERGQPNYSYMEQVMRNIEYRQIVKYVRYLEQV